MKIVPLGSSGIVWTSFRFLTSECHFSGPNPTLIEAVSQIEAKSQMEANPLIEAASQIEASSLIDPASRIEASSQTKA